jgi:hypothetical protein
VSEAPDVLDAAWQHTLAAWDDAALHDKLLALAGDHDRYAWLAARYRERAKANAEDAIAKARLERIQKATLARLMATATPKPDHAPQAYRATMAMLGVLIIAIIASVVYAVVRSSTEDEQVRTIPAPAAPGERK